MNPFWIISQAESAMFGQYVQQQSVSAHLAEYFWPPLDRQFHFFLHEDIAYYYWSRPRWGRKFAA